MKGNGTGQGKGRGDGRGIREGSENGCEQSKRNKLKGKDGRTKEKEAKEGKEIDRN